MYIIIEMMIAISVTIYKNNGLKYIRYLKFPNILLGNYFTIDQLAVARCPMNRNQPFSLNLFILDKSDKVFIL